MSKDLKALTKKFKCPYCGKKVSYGKSKYHKCTPISKSAR